MGRRTSDAAKNLLQSDLNGSEYKNWPDPLFDVQRWTFDVHFFIHPSGLHSLAEPRSEREHRTLNIQHRMMNGPQNLRCCKELAPKRLACQNIKTGPILNSMFDVGRSMFDVHFFIHHSMLDVQCSMFIFSPVLSPFSSPSTRFTNTSSMVSCFSAAPVMVTPPAFKMALICCPDPALSFERTWIFFP